MKINFTKQYQPDIQHDKIQVKRRRWDRWLYLVILIILVSSFLKWLLFPYVYYSADGFLLQQQHDVKFAYDVRIVEYKINEDQEINVGDTLFLYEKYTGQNNNSFITDSLDLVAKQNQSKINIITLDAQIAKRRLFLQDLRKRLAYWEQERQRKQKLVYLDVITPNELANVDRSIDDVKNSINEREVEFKVLLWEKSQLQKLGGTTEALEFKEMNVNHAPSAFTSPVKGFADRLRTPIYQISYKGETVTTIIYKDYFVMTYLKLQDLEDFSVGDKVTVILPYNKETLDGRVRKIYAVSELRDDRLQEDVRDDSKLNIIMEVIPEKGDSRWDSLKVSNIPVKVRKINLGL